MKKALCLMVILIGFLLYFFIIPITVMIHKGPIQTKINTECIDGHRHYNGIPLYKFDKNAKNQTSQIYCWNEAKKET
jgi:hypothetical protein